jgi:hypothetical protein
MYTIAHRIKIATRAPGFYFSNQWRRIFGSNETWKQNSRDDYPVGAWQWLALSELRYGGYKPGVASENNRGGDRMSPFDGHICHGYGFSYAEFLKPWMVRRMEPLILVEIGILNGSGLAMWCDLFPNARVIGLDLDLRNFNNNRAFLESHGAFSKNAPELFEFDQLDLPKARNVLRDVLGDTRVDIAIDDGCHSLESIKITFEALKPHLNSNFVYFIEDNFETYDALSPQHREYRWSQRGEMVVLRNR